jgi:ubiquinone/menaquinone biosynthesis C-methylase UbiE
MSRVNDCEIVKVQYNTDKNLNMRGILHQKFSTNKYGWAKWAFDKYCFPPMSNILELGCGNGAIWKSNKNRIPENIHLTLTDLSEGMLEAAKLSLEEISQIEYLLMDIQDMEYQDNLFDLVIANHMLYHVPSRMAAIKEVSRVVKPNGSFYASTNGRNNLKELKEILKDFDSHIDFSTYSVAEEFGLENGSEQLTSYFEEVELFRYEDALEITEPEPLIDYVLSMEGHSNVTEIIKGKKVQEFESYLSDLISKNGSIHISKDAGMFIAKFPKKKCRKI